MRLYRFLILMLLAACVPQVQSYKPYPDIHATLADDDVLPYRSWVPKKKPTAVIIAVHGFNDYSHAFEGSGAFFRAHGVAVYSYDQRGFGKAPHTGIWAGEENLINDLKHYVVWVSARYPHTPVYILGESMGGAVAIVALADPSFPKVQGMILSAPAVWGAETMNPIYRGALWMAAHTVPFRRVTGKDLKVIASNNYPMLRALFFDPLVIKKTRIDAIYGMVHLMDSAYEEIPRIATPTLLLYGGHDQVIPPFPIKNAIVHFNMPVEYAYYPDGYHMLLRDLQGKRVMADILSWMQHPGKPLPSGFSKMHSASQDIHL